MNTSFSISEQTQIRIATYFLPFYNINMALSTVVNAILVLITIRSKELRGVSNILIAVQAAGDMFTTWEVPIYTYNTLTRNFIPVTACFFYQLFPLLGMNLTTVTILMIGVDRLFIVSRPNWYRSVNKQLYLLVLLLLYVFYSLLVTSAMFLTSTEDRVLCFITGAMTGRGKDVWAVSQCLINIAVIVVYGKAKKTLKTQTIADKNARKIFHSLYLVMMFYIGGWVTSISLLLLTRIFITDVRLTEIVELGLSCFAAFNLCVPFFVYYFQSPVYRREIRRLFFLRSTVGPASSVPSLRNEKPSGSLYHT